jgi:hypothetical protein
MTDEIETLSKDGLMDFASVRGIDVDGRWSPARMREAIRAALHDDTVSPAGLVAEVVLTDIADIEDGEVVAPVAPVVAPQPAPRPASINGMNVDAVVWEWAEGFCSGLELAFADFDGGMMTVTIRTLHGETVETVDGVAITPDSVTAALAIIRAKIIG